MILIISKKLLSPRAIFVLVMLGFFYFFLKQNWELATLRSLHEKVSIAEAKEQEKFKPIGLGRNTATKKPLFDDSFSNVTGADHMIIPNIIHFIHLNTTEYSFVDFICLKAAFRNHHPDAIFIHTNVGEFTGKYWNWVKSDLELWERIQLIPTELPMEVFGQKLSTEWQLPHASDWLRINILFQCKIVIPITLFWLL